MLTPRPEAPGAHPPAPRFHLDRAGTKPGPAGAGTLVRMEATNRRADPTAAEPDRPLVALEAALQTVLEGQERTIHLSLACLLARGHLLLEDAPGTGKTTLSRAIARAVGLEFRRVQMTADMMPSDITGARYPAAELDRTAPGSSLLEQRFHFVPGPVFGELILADELNRTPPRTQSALLEAMAERSVTIEGETHPLPDPFFVVATQNPAEFAGTFPLPESQLDRFMMRLAPGYPSRDAELRVLRARRGADPLDRLEPVMSREELRIAMDAAADVHVAPPVEGYLLDLVAATRDPEQFELGASPRATLDLDAAARAHAHLDGRSVVLPSDVRDLAPAVLGHRVVPLDMVAPGSSHAAALLEALLDTVPAPRLEDDGSLRA